MTTADVNFCELVSEGQLTLMDCVKAAYPAYKHKSERAVKVQGNRLIKRKDIQQKVMELQKEFADVVKPSNEALKQEMVDVLVNGIRISTQGDPLTFVECVPAIKQLSQMLGWNAPTDVNVRNGGYTADYRPPSLMNMTDEEISAKLKELRGEK